MAPHRNGKLLLKIFYSCSFLYLLVESRLETQYQKPSDCKNGPQDLVHEIFDISSLKCTRCSRPFPEQIASSDKLRCVCGPGYKYKKNFNNLNIECEKCPGTDIASFSGWECVNCAVNPKAEECLCPKEDRKITVEKTITGEFFDNKNDRSCKTCADQTRPDNTGKKCERCTDILQNDFTSDNKKTCNCPTDNQANGVCIGSAADIPDRDTALTEVKYGSETISSNFFASNILSAVALCSGKYGNLTACQVVGNLCSMILHKLNDNPNACTEYVRLRGNTPGEGDWKTNLPMLYYSLKATDVLTTTQITTSFTFPNTQMPFIVTKYHTNGTFLGMGPVTGGLLQLCKQHISWLDAAYNFGTDFTQTCQIPVKDLLDSPQYETIFYDLFLEFEKEGKKYLFSVPSLVEDFEDSNGQKPNTGSQEDDWKLTRRFFLVDRVSGYEEIRVNENDQQGTGPASPSSQQNNNRRQKAIRYAKSLTLTVRLQDVSNKEGKIYPPFLKIKYDHVLEEDFENGKVEVSFNVVYEMNTNSYRTGMRISIAVLSSLAIVYAFFQTWNWYKRSGRINCDFFSLIKIVLYSFGSVGNALFAVALGSSFYWVVTFKNQSAVTLLPPTSDQETTFVICMVLAFVFKLLDLFHLIYVQSSIDIFCIDWERPKKEGESISIWRTYFVANEWNELQTFRKTSTTFQLILTIFFLHVVGFENLASKDPKSRYNPSDEDYVSENSRLFRFAIGGAVYLVIAISQWLIYVIFYQRFIEDKIRQYVDFCSLSNISPWAADATLKEMYEFLDAERNDKCPKRGIDVNGDQQTFQIAIPRALKDEYDRLTQDLAKRLNSIQTNDKNQRQFQSDLMAVETYTSVNKLLQSFISGDRTDITYSGPQRKTFVEGLLNIELNDTTHNGIFYEDDGHSFDSVLFFGNETTLVIFELLLFNLVDFIARNFVLAAFVTYIVIHLIAMIRESTSSSNLAKKTLVDKRFLI